LHYKYFNGASNSNEQEKKRFAPSPSCVVMTYQQPARVKCKVPCQILRVESREAPLRLIAIFGVSAVVGVRKQPPSIPKKLGSNQRTAMVRGAV
jgi:hypothetical protein